MITGLGVHDLLDLIEGDRAIVLGLTPRIDAVIRDAAQTPRNRVHANVHGLTTRQCLISELFQGIVAVAIEVPRSSMGLIPREMGIMRKHDQLTVDHDINSRTPNHLADASDRRLNVEHPFEADLIDPIVIAPNHVDVVAVDPLTIPESVLDVELALLGEAKVTKYPERVVRLHKPIDVVNEIVVHQTDGLGRHIELLASFQCGLLFFRQTGPAAELHDVAVMKVKIRCKESLRHSGGILPQQTTTVNLNTAMKLGASYNLWDGEELLEASIRQIRDQVDIITVVWQQVSNHGADAKIDLGEFVQYLIDRGLVDDTAFYTPNLKIGPSQNEITKRNMGVELSLKHECTHHQTMDTDEFYHAHEYAAAKKYIEKHDLWSTSVELFTYWKDAQHRFSPKESYYVPFIDKLFGKASRYRRKGRYYCRVDPSRKMQPRTHKGKNKYKILPPSMINMHHMSHVRLDYRCKLENSSAKKSYSRILTKLLDEHENWKMGQKVRGDFEIVTLDQPEFDLGFTPSRKMMFL